MYITWQTIITAGAVLGTTLTFVGAAWKIFKFNTDSTVTWEGGE